MSCARLSHLIMAGSMGRDKSDCEISMYQVGKYENRFLKLTE